MSAATLLGRYADIPPGDSSGNGSKEQDDKKAEGLPICRTSQLELI